MGSAALDRVIRTGRTRAQTRSMSEGGDREILCRQVHAWRGTGRAPTGRPVELRDSYREAPKGRNQCAAGAVPPLWTRPLGIDPPPYALRPPQPPW